MLYLLFRAYLAERAILAEKLLKNKEVKVYLIKDCFRSAIFTESLAPPPPHLYTFMYYSFAEAIVAFTSGLFRHLLWTLSPPPQL
jgi:hypothetical protein